MFYCFVILKRRKIFTLIIISSLTEHLFVGLYEK